MINTQDLEEVEGFLSDCLDDIDPPNYSSQRAAEHLLSCMEKEGIAVLPTSGQWPPSAEFKLGDDVVFSSCGGGTCHAQVGKVAGWFLQHDAHVIRSGAHNKVPPKIGYVVQYGPSYMTIPEAAVKRLTQG